MKRVLIKSIPYILSILWGIILAYISVYVVTNQDVSDLMNNIAASLLAIPIVFLVYNYSEYKTSSKLNKTLTTNLVFEINSSMLKLLTLFRHSLLVHDSFSWESTQRLLNRHAHDMKSKLKLTRSDIDILKADKDELNEHVFKSAKTVLLTGEQVVILSELVKGLSHVINEQKYGSSQVALATYVERVFSLMNDWFSTCDIEELRSHDHFILAMKRGVRGKTLK